MLGSKETHERVADGGELRVCRGTRVIGVVKLVEGEKGRVGACLLYCAGLEKGSKTGAVCKRGEGRGGWELCVSPGVGVKGRGTKFVVAGLVHIGLLWWKFWKMSRRDCRDPCSVFEL